LFEQGTSEFRNFGGANLEIQKIYSHAAKTIKLPVFSFLQLPNRTLLGDYNEKKIQVLSPFPDFPFFSLFMHA